DRTMRVFTRSAAVLFACCLAANVAAAQVARTPQQNAEFRRAEAAWLSGGSLLEAKERLDNVIESLPDDAPALVLRTKILLALERNPEAYRDAKSAFLLLPEDGEVSLLMTRAARLAGDTTLALEALRCASSTISTDAHSHLRLSIESLHLGRHEEAESLARVAVALDPRYSEARLQLARVLAVRGNTEAAAKALTAALDESLVTRDRIQSDSLLVWTGVARRVLENR
ncbi:MAG: tetratricopeptide repeat protein, partial [Rhodothermales bacterium]|nr:tetratricopeptide repeat protein [Rhodothermales bacterium]